jgi:hypothetical protein
MRYNGLMIFELFRWWYGAGWVRTARSSAGWVRNVERAFSAGILVQTLFAPWKRIVTVGGRSFDARLRALGDNFVSRCIGFVVRLFVLIGAGCSLVAAALASMVALVVWPALPLACLYFLVRGIIG